MQFSLNQPFFPTIVMFGRRLANWWWKELIELMPPRIVRFISGDDRRFLTLRVDQQMLSLTLSQRTTEVASVVRSLSTTGTHEEVDGFLVAHGLRRTEVDLGIELPTASFFNRQILLPIQAERAIDTIVVEDLVRKTPFRIEDIYYDYAVIRHEDAKTFDVRQWIVRRKFVDDALMPLGLTAEKIDFVSVETSVEPIQPCIRLRRDADTKYRSSHKLAFLMSCSALFLILAMGGLRYWHQQAEIDRLDGEVAAISQKAARVRMLIDQSEQRRNTLVRLRLQRNVAPGFIDLWDEVTRILPAHSWLTELRLSDGAIKEGAQVTLIGFSNAAPGLVATIDNSRLLFDATLTSPVSLDPVEGKERFTLQAKIRILSILESGQ